MKKYIFTIVALFCTTLLSAQEYMVVENPTGGYSSFDVSIIKQAYFVNYSASGEGTQTSPFNVAAANTKCKEIGEEPSIEKFYVKGFVISSGRNSNGPAAYIADDLTGINRLYVYHITLPNNVTLKYGDEIVIYGSLYNYRNITPEMEGYVININGQQYEDFTPQGSGTLENPYNVAAIIEQTASLAVGEFFNNSENVYVTGIVTETTDISASYGNATYYISDDAKGTNRFYVYRGKLLDGAAVTAETDLVVGDSVTVCGKIKNYKGTIEFDQGSYLTYIKKGDGTEQGGGGNTSGEGTAESPYSVTAAIAAGTGTGVYVKGFVVGSIDGKSTTDAKFSAETNTASNILIAASANETDVAKCMPVQLPTGDVRSALNLVDNAGNYKKEVTLYGNIEKYFSVTGLKSVTYAILNGTEIGTKPDGGNTGGDVINTVTVAEFIAAPVSTDVWYKLTGTISNLKDGDLYGNFDLTDATGSVYVYGLLSEKGGAKKLFQELVTKYGLTNGSTITIIGNRGEYNSKIEVMNAYISVDGSNGGGSSTGTFKNPLTGSQTYDIVAAMSADQVSTEDYYVKGKISSIKYTFSADYGTATFNFSDDGTAN